MNSKFRETFGILDPSTSKLYSDIIGASLQNRMISYSHIDRGYLTLGSSKYQIHVDKETLHEILYNYETYCVVSFQRRTNGCYAMVRLYKPSLVNKEI